MERLEEKRESGFGLSLIPTGAFISSYFDDSFSKVMGGIFIVGGVTQLWVNGYSPIKMAGEIIEGVGKITFLPYDYFKKRSGK